ncbi:N-acetylneuraminate synthase family protein [Telmatospirillum siberiense]|nr:N-acetylneuraminate synthase family protein [Telmatospirillum siberiense]
MGDVEHGLRVIREFAEVCRPYPFKFAFKLQYRHLDSLIHPDFIARTDIKYIKRFSETRLSRADTGRLVREIKDQGFIAMCTPFDEASVDLILEDGFDILKIASCSFFDWPLLEKVVDADRPVIASTAGVAPSDIDKVVTFLRNRKKHFALMHCVAEYPTPSEKLEINQIDFLKARYPDVPIGYSTHENPSLTLPVGLAIAKGCTIFEKHIGVPTDRYALNAYSATPTQVAAWLETAQQALHCCGSTSGRAQPSQAEADSLFALRRGGYAKRHIAAGERITDADVFFAIPTQPGHVTANDWSKYTQFYAERAIEPNQPVLVDNTRQINTRDTVLNIVERVKALLRKGNIIVPGQAELEISHHYGLERFDECGITMITVVNREYCKKLIVVLPGQRHPEQYHNLKEETFVVLHGSLELTLNGAVQTYGAGSVAVVERGVKHAFESAEGVVFEEISSTHYVNDSFYTDSRIGENKQRKTVLSYWLD